MNQGVLIMFLVKKVWRSFLVSLLCRQIAHSMYYLCHMNLNDNTLSSVKEKIFKYSVCMRSPEFSTQLNTLHSHIHIPHSRAESEALVTPHAQWIELPILPHPHHQQNEQSSLGGVSVDINYGLWSIMKVIPIPLLTTVRSLHVTATFFCRTNGPSNQQKPQK